MRTSESLAVGIDAACWDVGYVPIVFSVDKGVVLCDCTKEDGHFVLEIDEKSLEVLDIRKGES